MEASKLALGNQAKKIWYLKPEELAEKLRSMELTLLDLWEDYGDSKDVYKLALLDKSQALESVYAETKDKTLSTAEKRERKALEDPKLAALKEKNDKRLYSIKVAEIEKRYVERAFEVKIRERPR